MPAGSRALVRRPGLPARPQRAEDSHGLTGSSPTITVPPCPHVT